MHVRKGRLYLMKKLWPQVRDQLPEARWTFDHLGIHKELVHFIKIVSVKVCMLCGHRNARHSGISSGAGP
jgi:hypothetical protein